MKYSDKIVVNIPMTSIWNEFEEIAVIREQYLDKEKIKQIIGQQPVDFVVADVGKKLKWVGINKCYDFWKSEVEKHLVINLEKIDLNNYPDNYAYLASEWKSKTQRPIILLEKMH